MSDTSNNTSSGIVFGGLLTVLFIGLKLGHVINWSWWWVLSPIWIGVAIFVLILLFVGIVVGLVSMLTSDRNKKETFEPHAGKTLGL